MAYAVNDGVRIHYEIVGNGPPLILQHGITYSIEEWHYSGYVTPLSARYRLWWTRENHGQVTSRMNLRPTHTRSS